MNGRLLRQEHTPGQSNETGPNAKRVSATQRHASLPLSVPSSPTAAQTPHRFASIRITDPIGFTSFTVSRQMDGPPLLSSTMPFWLPDKSDAEVQTIIKLLKLQGKSVSSHLKTPQEAVPYLDNRILGPQQRAFATTFTNPRAMGHAYQTLQNSTAFHQRVALANKQNQNYFWLSDPLAQILGPNYLTAILGRQGVPAPDGSRTAAPLDLTDAQLLSQWRRGDNGLWNLNSFYPEPKSL